MGGGTGDLHSFQASAGLNLWQASPLLGVFYFHRSSSQASMRSRSSKGRSGINGTYCHTWGELPCVTFSIPKRDRTIGVLRYSAIASACSRVENGPIAINVLVTPSPGANITGSDSLPPFFHELA